MSQEIELKLTISSDSVKALLSLELLAPYTPQLFLLENTYFDTPEQLLTQAGSALRIRKTPNGLLQTLKNRGKSIGGLHQRDEFEMKIAHEQIDLSLFPVDAYPKDLNADDLCALFSTNFKRTCWTLEYQQSQIEVVLDIGDVIANDQTDQIHELELELKDGTLADLFALALEISEHVALMPSDISKAERGYRLCSGNNDVAVELPEIIAQQSMESAFMALFGYEMERLQRHWQFFWSTQQWRHLQSFLVTLGNLETEIEWFQSMLPSAQIQFVHEQVDWISDAVKPILSWWPACFALSQDAEQEPQSVAVSLQQSKAKKAIRALRALQSNPELGYRLLSLTAWLHGRSWRVNQTQSHVSFGELPVIDGLDNYFDKAMSDLQGDCFAGSTSHALSQSPAVHRLLMLCQYFDRLYGQDVGGLHSQLQALEDNLSRLSAIDVVATLKDWLNDLPIEQQASVHSWTRSQTVLLRDIKQLASKLISGRDSVTGQTI